MLINIFSAVFCNLLREVRRSKYQIVAFTELNTHKSTLDMALYLS